MERIAITPRADWQVQVESLGFSFHSIDNMTYWDESACYRFSAKQVDELEEATNNIEDLCMEVVEHVIVENRFAEFNIPEYAWPLIAKSWQRRDRPLYGRLDFSYDGVQPPKLLEYNADTPTSLLESSVVQWQWLEQVRPTCDQFNSLHEQLVNAWRYIGAKIVHLSCLEKNEEDFINLAYLADTAAQAGLIPKMLPIERISWNGKDFLDDENAVIKTLFKLYPWEWMLEDEFGKHLVSCEMNIVEPAWKMLLSNKALVVLLWELFPNHPNLLPAFFNPSKLSGDYVKKPLLSREGENVSIYGEKGTILTEGGYDDGHFIYQQAQYLPNFDGNYPVIGSWLVCGNSAGICVREDNTPITTNAGRFIPHFFE